MTFFQTFFNSAFPFLLLLKKIIPLTLKEKNNVVTFNDIAVRRKKTTLSKSKLCVCCEKKRKDKTKNNLPNVQIHIGGKKKGKGFNHPLEKTNIVLSDGFPM